MRKTFVDWYLVREAAEDETTKQIDNVIDQTRQEIEQYFKSLYQAVERTWGRGASPFPDKLRADLVTDLQKIMQKIRGPAQAVPSFAIESALQEVEQGITGGLTPVRTGVTGTPQFHLRDVLHNMKEKVIASLQKLKNDLIMIHLNELGKKMVTVGKNYRKIPGELTKIRSSIQRASNLGIPSEKIGDVKKNIIDIVGYADRIGLPRGSIRISPEGGAAREQDIQSPGDLNKILDAAKQNRHMIIRVRRSPRSNPVNLHVDISSTDDVVSKMAELRELLAGTKKQQAGVEKQLAAAQRPRETETIPLAQGGEGGIVPSGTSFR